jgi:hypothetical protein
MNIDTGINLDTLHASIVADIRAKFPTLATVEFYRAERTQLPTPACLLTLTELEAAEDEDPGTEQIAVYAHFEAQLIVSFRQANAKNSIRNLAGAFMGFLRKRKWTDPANPGKKLPTGECLPVGAYEDDFASITAGQRDTNLDQFEIFRVEWRQLINLGETAWNDTGVTPSIVFMGQAPEIGPAHLDDYVQVAP